MKFACFADEYAERVAVNPANVRFVREPDNPKGPTYIELVNGRVAVMATFDEVVSVLQGVDAPPVAPVVGLDSADLERAAKVLDLIADAAGDGIDDVAIDQAIGANGIEWTDTMEKARALATRLRGRAS